MVCSLANCHSAEVVRSYGVEVVGRTDAVREQFFAISVERGFPIRLSQWLLNRPKVGYIRSKRHRW